MDDRSNLADYDRRRRLSDEITSEQMDDAEDGVCHMHTKEPVYRRDIVGSSYVPHVLLAIFVCLAFGVVIGFVALIYAVKAARIRASDPNGHAAAKAMGDRSIALSIIGIGFGLALIVIIGLAVGLTTNNGQDLPSSSSASVVARPVNCTYIGPDNVCYGHMMNQQDQPTCSSSYQGTYDPKTRSCYFNKVKFDHPAAGNDNADDHVLGSSTSTTTAPVTAQCSYYVGPNGQCYRWIAETENVDEKICQDLYHGVFDAQTSRCHYNIETVTQQASPSNSTDTS